MELEEQPFYQKGVNAEEDGTTPFVTSEEKRSAIYKMSVDEFRRLVLKIKNIHSSITLSNKITDSYVEMDVCGNWAKNRQQERKLPFQEKHSLQQASILGNMEIFGILKQKVDHLESEFPISENGMHSTPAVVEFGAGRGYLTQMLVDCYGIYKVFFVERRAYKLKADRSLRKNKSIKILQRLRIDIEDLNLDAVNQLRGLPYLAIGKHICGPATDLTLRCCFHGSYHRNENAYPKGLALAMCCHHLCQWKHYINKKFLKDMRITMNEFHAITWLSSWAVDTDHTHHSLNSSNVILNHDDQLSSVETVMEGEGVEAMTKKMKLEERVTLGFICKDIIDIGRLLWVEERGLHANLVKYVPPNISPENHLLVAKWDG